jgi:hypothetical protein
LLASVSIWENNSMPGLLILERMLSLFALAQLLHIARWRWGGQPPGYLFWFLKVWLIAPSFAIVLWLAGRALVAGSPDWDDASAWLGAFIGYGALCGAYVQIYPAMATLSPSLEIVRSLMRTPGAVMAIQSIEMPTISGEEGVAYRVTDLLSTGFAAIRGGELELTAKGLQVASLLDRFRALLGIERGTEG